MRLRAAGTLPARIVALGPDDADRLRRAAAIEAAALPSPWGAQVLRAEAARADRIYLVVLEGDEVVGFGGLALQTDDAHLMTLAVAPTARRRGHGEALVRALLAAAAAQDATGVTLEVRVGNVAARRLYRRVGFRSAGVRPGYYPDGEDAVILWWHPDGTGAATARGG